MSLISPAETFKTAPRHCCHLAEPKRNFQGQGTGPPFLYSPVREGRLLSKYLLPGYSVGGRNALAPNTVEGNVEKDEMNICNRKRKRNFKWRQRKTNV
jgi:hypothetical protein